MESLPVFKTKVPAPTLDDPWAGDVLCRDKSGKALEDLVVGQQESLSIAVDGNWGSGKTFFAERWEMQLRKDGFKVVHYNAWEDDYVDDPMLSLVVRLWSDLGLAKSKSELSGKLAKDLKTTLAFSGRVVKGAAIHFAKKIIEDWTGVDKDALDKFADDDVSDAGKLLKAFEDESKAKDVFQTALSGLVDHAISPKGDSGVQKPLVFVVDELDRCRPVFAVKVLERIKHFLSIPHVAFIFCIDREQLSRSLKAVYGDIDTDNYLHRFFDFELRLPEASPEAFCKMLWNSSGLDSFLSRLDGDENGLGDSWKNRSRRVVDVFSMLAGLHHLSLREIEHSFRAFSLLLRTYDKSLRSFQPELLAVHLYLRLKEPELDMRFIRMESPVDDIINALIPTIPPVETRHFACSAIQATAQYLARLDPDIDFMSPQFDSAMSFLKWINSEIVNATSGDQQGSSTACPKCVPAALHSWTKGELHQIAEWAHPIDDQIKTSFFGGNPLERYESILNLLSMVSPSG